jgi:lysophospholipase L1-like esterase
MSNLDLVAQALLGISVALAAATARADGDVALRRDLDSLASRSVFFGHMSVGMNLLAGLDRLAASQGVTLRVTDVSARPAAAPGTLSHVFVGHNGDPRAKLAAFQQAFEALPPAEPRVALLKFCYVDFGPDTDAAALFADYQARLAALRARAPATTFVHVTAPLTTVQGGAKGLAKRLLGKAPSGLRENQRREEFNERMRAAYRGREPIFDLARVEATAPDGTLRTVEVDGRQVPVLVEAYTDDGGHLDGAGQVRAARELLAVLAALPATPPAAP